MKVPCLCDGNILVLKCIFLSSLCLNHSFTWLQKVLHLKPLFTEHYLILLFKPLSSFSPSEKPSFTAHLSKGKNQHHLNLLQFLSDPAASQLQATKIPSCRSQSTNKGLRSLFPQPMNDSAQKQRFKKLHHFLLANNTSKFQEVQDIHYYITTGYCLGDNRIEQMYRGKLWQEQPSKDCSVPTGPRECAQNQNSSCRKLRFRSAHWDWQSDAAVWDAKCGNKCCSSLKCCRKFV